MGGAARRFLPILLVFVVAVTALPAVAQTPARKLHLPLVARELPVPTPVPARVRIQYRVFSQDDGWSAWQDEGGVAGVGGKHVRALEMRIASGPPGATIKYRVHIGGVGWQPQYIVNGGTAGSEGGNPIEAVQVGLENVPAGTYVSVEPHVHDWGWLGYVPDLWQAGTTGQGRTLEAIRAYIRVGSPEPGRVGVAYDANPRGMGYLGWKRNGEFAGTTGKQLPLDTFKVALFNKPEGMKLRYRCWVQESDWQAWQEDGGECGLFGTNKAIYSFEIQLTTSSQPGVFTYTGHFQNKGDLTWSSDNVGTNVNGTLGTPSEKFQLEALRATFQAP